MVKMLENILLFCNLLKSEQTKYIERSFETFDMIETGITPLSPNDVLLVFDLDETLYDMQCPLLAAHNLLRRIEKYSKSEQAIDNPNNILFPINDIDYVIEKDSELYVAYLTANENVKYFVNNNVFAPLILRQPIWFFLKQNKKLIELLEKLSNSENPKYRMIISTNASRKHSEQVLHKLGIAHFFEKVFYWRRSTDPFKVLIKPNPRAYLIIEKYYGLYNNDCDCEDCIANIIADFSKSNEKKNIIFFDDLKENIEGCELLNWTGYHIKSNDDITERIIDSIIENTWDETPLLEQIIFIDGNQSNTTEDSTLKTEIINQALEKKVEMPLVDFTEYLNLF